MVVLMLLLEEDLLLHEDDALPFEFRLPLRLGEGVGRRRGRRGRWRRRRRLLRRRRLPVVEAIFRWTSWG